MWILVKIGILYGAPIVALTLAVAWFVVLFLRVRRGVLDRTGAALRYLWTLVLPPAVVIVIWATGEFASYFAANVDRFVLDYDAATSLLVSLLPIGAYVGVAVAVLNIVFWLALSLSRMPHANHPDAA